MSAVTIHIDGTGGLAVSTVAIILISAVRDIVIAWIDKSAQAPTQVPVKPTQVLTRENTSDVKPPGQFDAYKA